MRLFSSAILGVFVVACGGSAASVGDAPPADATSDATPSGGAAEGKGSEPDAPDAAALALNGAKLTLVLKGSTAPVPHADGLSGETAKVQVAAIKSLWLLRSADDPNPVRVFDLGASPVLVDYVTGAPVTLATVARTSIPSGTYRVAKVGVSFVHYRVASRLHANGVTVDGDYDNVQALSDGAPIDGTPRARGWYRYSFLTGATPLGSVEGGSAPTPVVPSGGGVTLDTSGPEAFYTFGFDAAFDATATYDETVTFEANVHQGFRWQDQALPGYAAGVFDTTTTSFEPVMAFGANAYAVSFARSP